MQLRPCIVGTIAINSLLLSACSKAGRDSGAVSTSAVESIYTDLSGGACREEIDKNDPNGTPYAVCPGVAGYTLVVRLVESGRQSVDVVVDDTLVFPLTFQESVTPQMSALRGKAEWRVQNMAGKAVPIALIVAVDAHENTADPETITRTYLAVAKIASSESCVVEKVLEGGRSEAAVRILADSAQVKPCVLRQPR